MEGWVQRDCAANRASHNCMPSPGREAPVCVEFATEYMFRGPAQAVQHPLQPSAEEGGGGVGSQPRSHVEAHNVTGLHRWALTEVGHKELFPFTTIQNPP